jgi:hypothetical protein
MLRVSAAQMQSFRSAAQSDFERRILIYLAEKHPDYAQQHGETGLRELVKNCRVQADAADVGTENGIVTWAELVIGYGDGFHKSEPWANYILTLDLDAAERIERLREYV